jgi:nucleoside phosphorylase
MIAGRSWVERNLGFDPLKTPAPESTFAFKAAARTRAPEDFAREVIDFDSEASEGFQFFAFSKATGLSRFVDIPWPSSLAPKTGKTAGAGAGAALPRADVLIVTWTVDEGHALSRVLTPGKDSHNDYQPYTHNWSTLSGLFRKGAPADAVQRLGTFWTTSIGGKSVVVFKSDSHMSQDGPKFPNLNVWQQIIAEVQPRLVITTGTAGGIGAGAQVGDVVVSPIVRFDCLSKFKAKPFHADHYSSAPANTKHFAKATKLFSANAQQLPPDNVRPPKIIVAKPGSLKSAVLTTDFFGFDTSNDHYKLQGLGSVCEMGDAVLGLAASTMGAQAPKWLAIRNVSDPQIKSEGTLRQQAAVAAQIYKGFGRWSSVCSAIVCWASVAAL